jgi:transcriptional regulator PpsR
MTKSGAPDLTRLSSVAPQMADALVLLASDIALVVDEDGIIRNVSQRNAEPVSPGAGGWVGSAWTDVVGAEGRAKVERLMAETLSTGRSRRREINQPGVQGSTVPLEFTAMRLGDHGPVLAVGRDLRAVAAIQQRFLEAQQDIEKSYWRARQADAQYRLLFEVATDAVLVVDAESYTILEANESASNLFSLSLDKMLGRPATFAFHRQYHEPLIELFNVARTSAQPAEASAQIIGRVTGARVAATPFRAERGLRLLVRVRTAHTPGSSAELSSALSRLVRGTTDGIVVTEAQGRVLMANPAFSELLRLGHQATIKGRLLSEWVDGPLQEMFDGVRLEGVTHPTEFRLRTASGAVVPVLIHGSLLTEGDQECLGFTIHPMAPGGTSQLEDLGAAMERLTARLGTDTLGLLLQEARELARTFFIARALERAGGNITLAAEMLGVKVDTLTALRGQEDE